MAEMIDNGTLITGTILSLCGPKFQDRFNNAGMILAKEMGNHEILSEVSTPIFFLLQMKFPIIGPDVLDWMSGCQQEVLL
jgi:uncharacterized protein with ATP-grasp and redox domains